MDQNKQKRVIIIWGRESAHSKLLGKSLSARPKEIYFKKMAECKLLVPFRYLVQTFCTWVFLFKERPDYVLVQNPPVFASLSVFVYCFIFRKKFLIDSHTAAFIDKKWRYFFPLFKFVAKRAQLNTAHNFKNLEILKEWGIEKSIVSAFPIPQIDKSNLDKPLLSPELETRLKNSDYPILMVNRFANDDAFKEVIETAKLMPDKQFFITGNLKYAPKEATENVPENVVFTDYLENAEFLKLMHRSRLVLALTLRKDTRLWSIQEAIVLSKPFVTSDTEVLRHYFKDIGIFSESNAVALKDGILEAKEKEGEIKVKAPGFKERLINDYKKTIHDIEKYLK